MQRAEDGGNGHRQKRRRRADGTRGRGVAVCVMHERHAMKMKICVYGRGG